MLSIRM